tara:strand:+ start:93 stop:710 length:618 start_codon:yes stop_codon:yes gene_type:complete
MATQKKNNSFLNKTLKDDIKKIVSDVVNSNSRLTSNDIDQLVIKKTDNGYILEYNDGTSSEPPTVEVIQTDEMDGTEDAEMYKEGLLSLLYNVALWSGYEYDPKSNSNLNIDWSLVGDEDDDSENETEEIIPPTKEQVIAAAMGNVNIPQTEEQDEEQLMDDAIVTDEDDLNSNEWVAGDDYSGNQDDLDDDDLDDGYNEEFEDE